MKRFISFLLFLLCLTVFSVSALAEDVIASGMCGENAFWELTGDGTLYIRGSGEMDDYESDNGVHTRPWRDYYNRIKTVVMEDGITRIGDCSFVSCSSLTGITIPDSVISIGDNAFYGCTSLASVTIPDGVASIGRDAFGATPWLENQKDEFVVVGDGVLLQYNGTDTEVEIPKGIKYISNAFDRCSLAVVTIPNSVTSIGDGAFVECTGFTDITIPDSVTSIGEGAFCLCESLRSITIPDSVMDIGHGAFFGCAGLADESGFVIVRNVLFDYMYKYVSDPNFTSEVTIPDGVTRIDGGFYGAQISSVTIPDSVTSIGEGAFQWCESLRSITIPNSVTSIGDYAFYGCESLAGVSIPNSVTSIGDYAFGGCRGFTDITIPDSVTSIGYYAFAGCTGFTDITIPDSVTSIGERAFYSCESLRSITIPDSVTSIGKGAFQWCESLRSITISDSVTSIGEGAFYGCTSLAGVTIPNSVTSIGDNAFIGCTSLAGVTIPDSVTSIGKRAFYSCESLRSITIPDSVMDIGNGAFFGCAGLADESGFVIVRNVLYDYMYKYVSEPNFTSEVTIPDGVTRIDGGFDRAEISSVTIPDSVTSISAEAFDGNTLEYVYFEGTKEEWDEIEISSGNETLTEAKIDFLGDGNTIKINDVEAAYNSLVKKAYETDENMVVIERDEMPSEAEIKYVQSRLGAGIYACLEPDKATHFDTIPDGTKVTVYYRTNGYAFVETEGGLVCWCNSELLKDSFNADLSKERETKTNMMNGLVG